MRQAFWAIALLAVCGVSASCGQDAGVSNAGLSDAQKEAAKDVQKGGAGGGVKANNGGGVMPEPETPKAGQHVGAPTAGGKSGG